MKIAVLMGGVAHEHDISLNTGFMVTRHLLAAGREIRPVIILRDGRFQVGRPIQGESDVDRLEASDGFAAAEDLLELEAPALEATMLLRDKGTDVVFVALHGIGGEDGAIQGFLDWAGLPYTGSGVVASALAMDKCAFKPLLVDRGLPTSPFLNVLKSDWRTDRAGVLARGLAGPGLPAFVKIADRGSSYGVRLVADEAELASALDELFGESFKVLWEAKVNGTELTCAVLGRHDDTDLETFPVVEIVPKKGDFFDLESKYDDGGADEIVPARVSEAVATRMAEIAREVHRLVACDGMSRTDAILSGDQLFVLETNTIPGLTPASLYPKAARAAGLGFKELLDCVIDLARGQPPLAGSASS